ncbi:MAG: hypothetical protein QF890_09895 [Myxococcota bacterium]|jgi:hypothetical protein|nr:hypothetical protein [Deltaproteobacteria bacterium]MCP4243075.1 hypothetical protein [bacterium]MDP6076521.1 hypothetical protein [Myxococcota bacterium]MDP6242189.1 hypothetical protein [Myxococcota bacterium]MDP7075701.1 hypothetical protein [Myxococcota bacterium]
MGAPTLAARCSAADRGLEVSAALLAVATALALLPEYSGFFHDDAYISLRYAARWLAGRGLTWNDGEFVEGFTHPLWLFQVAGLGAAGVELRTAARGLGVASFAALLAVWRPAGASWVAAPLVAMSPPLLLWAWGGLETVSFCLWLVIAVAMSERLHARPDGAGRIAYLAGLAFAAAALLRPEGLALGLLATGLLALGGRGRSARTVLLGLLAPCALYLAFRLAWFGELLPNSAQAKLGGLPPLDTLRLGTAYLVETSSFWTPALGIAGVAVLLRPRGPYRLELFAFTLLGAACLSGGDHMPGARFAAPAAVLFVFAAGCRMLRLTPRRKFVAFACVLAAIGALAAFTPRLPTVLDPAARAGARVGRFLADALPPGTLVATATAGSTPYYAPELSFVDTLGLNDRRIARRDPVPMEARWQRVPGHLKGDGPYVLERAPDVVILGPAQGYIGKPARGWFLTDFELVTNPTFHARYAPYNFTVRDVPESPLDLVLYLRQDSPAARNLIRLGTPAVPPRTYVPNGP